MKPPDAFFLKLAKPAQRALANAGITSLEQLAKYSEQEIALLHGIGPNALRQIRQAFKEKGLSFTEKK
jgi:predicted flap endonuclease-1-like 5' DNA nuclease